MTSFSKWDRDAYRARVGEEEAARRRGAIMAEQWGYQLAEQRKRLGFTQAGLAEIMGSRRAGSLRSSTARSPPSRPSPATSPLWAESWNSSRTSADTCSRCRPTRRPDLAVS